MMEFRLKSYNNRIYQLLFVFVFAAVVLYWIFRFSTLLSFDGEEAYMGSLGLFLLSWTLIFGLASVLAWLNFRLLFFIWRKGDLTSFQFWTLELLVFAAFFELLQWRTGHDASLMRENLLVVMFLAIYFIVFIWIAEGLRVRRREKQLLQQKERAELMLLQSQLNPHFLFNALNSIYSNAIMDGSGKTAEQIQGLSVLMRFAIEKSNLQKVSLSEELEFLNRYVQVHLDRLSDEQRPLIEWSVNWDEESAEICPMLVQPMIENGFKFSDFSIISIDPLIKMNLTVEGNTFQFTCENACKAEHVLRNKGTGKGLNLVRQRLANLYPGRHRLEIEEEGGFFKVFLQINLN
ncbi:sensor histidine kinase [Litoribacter populi]|uniref:sensor histidine kinase n=1 Tax=Litoribacter populi TaxID=2598460 RepID=UPI00117EC924|nr:histidine kinase [Litoribacter populi]